MAPLTFEYTLQDGDQWLDTSTRTLGDGSTVQNSTSYELRNLYLYYDICTLDSSVQSEYSQLMRSGGALNVIYQTALMQTPSVLSNAFTIQIRRNIARVNSIFSSFLTATGDNCKTRGCKELNHPASAVEDQDSTVK